MYWRLSRSERNGRGLSRRCVVAIAHGSLGASAYRRPLGRALANGRDGRFGGNLDLGRITADDDTLEMAPPLERILEMARNAEHTDQAGKL